MTVHVIGPDITGYRSLAAETGGMWFDIGSDDFSAIIDSIGVVISSNYVITYMTKNSEPETTRTVRVAVHTLYGTGEGTATYHY